MATTEINSSQSLSALTRSSKKIFHPSSAMLTVIRRPAAVLKDATTATASVCMPICFKVRPCQVSMSEKACTKALLHHWWDVCSFSRQSWSDARLDAKLVTLRVRLKARLGDAQDRIFIPSLPLGLPPRRPSFDNPNRRPHDHLVQMAHGSEENSIFEACPKLWAPIPCSLNGRYTILFSNSAIGRRTLRPRNFSYAVRPSVSTWYRRSSNPASSTNHVSTG